MRSKTYTDDNSSKDKTSRSKSRKYKKARVDKKEVLDSRGRDNDPNWYFTSPELADQAAQLSFQSVLGYDSLYGHVVPSIARIDTVMNPGVTYKVNTMNSDKFEYIASADSEYVTVPMNGKAGVNLMAAKLYTTLSSFTGRTASYAPQDVAMMILQISAIAELSETIRRVFGLALTYNFRNRSLPLGIIRSMGIDTFDLTSKLSVYRMRFNVAMSRINQIPLLENIAFIKKSRDVYQRVYMDDPTNMSQLFYYMPTYYYVLDEIGDDEGSVLRAFPLTASDGSAENLSIWLANLEEMITAALESSTLNFIYADLLNMANKLNVQTWQFDYLAENYVVMPEYNQNALLQFHNLTIMGRPQEIRDIGDDHDIKALIKSIKSGYDKDVYVTGGASVFCNADANEIVYNPTFSDRYSLGKWVVDMPTDKPTTVDRIESLRYTGCNSGYWITPTSIDNALMTYNGFIFNVLPDHFVSDMIVFNNIDLQNSGAQGVIYDRSIINYNTGNIYSSDVTRLSQLSQFEHAPIVAQVNGVDPRYLLHVYGGLQYFTEIDATYVSRLLDLMTIGAEATTT